jgi:hypothetical protein
MQWRGPLGLRRCTQQIFIAEAIGTCLRERVEYVFRICSFKNKTEYTIGGEEENETDVTYRLMQ